MEDSEEIKYNNPIDIAEQIKKLRKERKIAGTLEEGENLDNQIWRLVKEKSAMRVRLNKTHQQMHEAAEEAEKAGVGAGGKGSSED